MSATSQEIEAAYFATQSSLIYPINKLLISRIIDLIFLLCFSSELWVLRGASRNNMLSNFGFGMRKYPLAWYQMCSIKLVPNFDGLFKPLLQDRKKNRRSSKLKRSTLASLPDNATADHSQGPNSSDRMRSHAHSGEGILREGKTKNDFTD